MNLRRFINNLVFSYLSVFLLMLLPSSAWAQLSGSYTINPNGSGASNYKSFGDAISALKSQGVNSSVNFEVADGTYNEAILLQGNINGLSGSQRVSFLGGSKDSSLVLIKGSSQFQMRLEVSNLVFKHIGIETSHLNGRAVFINDAALINIENCHISATGTGNTSGVFLFESDNITIAHNFIDEAYYGIYANASNGPSQENNYSNNSIPRYRNAGMYLQAQNGIIINENVIGGSFPNNIGKGIYLREVSKGQVERNTIVGGDIALDISFANRAIRNAKDSLRCANNFIHVSAANTPLSVLKSERVNLYHNTITARNSENSLYCKENDDFSIVNNHLIADSCKFGIYLDQDTSTTINLFDYNVFSFNSCNKFGFYNVDADSFRNFKLLDTFSNINSSISNQKLIWLHGKPLGLSGTDNLAKYIGITKDLAGNTRPFPTDTGVDVGCFEFKLDTISLAIASLISPEALSLTSNKVRCEIVNAGTHHIYNKTYRIAYSIDGSTWVFDSLIIDTLITGEAFTFSFLKRFSLATPQDVSLEIVIDNWPLQNTGLTAESRTFNLCFGLLGGTYTIGKTGDYKTINEAISALKCGIASSVVFEIEDGTYDEEIVFRKTPGASHTRTITFISKSKKASKVKIESNSLYVIDFLTAHHVIFKNITVSSKHVAKGLYNTVRISARSNQVQFDSCVINGPSGSSAFAVLIKSADSSLFSNCKIYGGKVGLVIEGNRAQQAPNGNSIVNSEIKHFRSGAFVANYSNGTSIISSVIDSSLADTASQFLKDVEFFNSTEINFQQNKVFSNCIALNLQDCEHQTNGYSIFASNQIISKGYYSLMVNNTDSIRFIHNTILSNKALIGIWITKGLNHKWLNNNIVVNRAVEGINAELLGNSVFDFNNLYIKKANKPIIFNNQGFQNNENLKSTLGVNVNGFNTKPYFKNNRELKHQSGMLNNAAKKSISLVDIGGNQRLNIDDDGIDIGAFEVSLSKHSLEILSLKGPLTLSSNANTIETVFENNGADTFINSRVLVRYSVDSGKTFHFDTLRLTQLAPGATIPFSFSRTWTPNRNGVFTLTVEVVEALSNEKIKPSIKEYILCSGIEGNYTIGTNGDYNTIRQAIKALECGVTGPVVFTIEDGTYREQVKIGKIIGASNTNNITFKGTRKAIIEYHGSSSTDRYCIIFNNASHINFEGITLTGIGGFASGVLFSNNSQHNKIRKCFFNFKAYSTLSTNVSVAFSHDLKNNFINRNGSYNLIDSNEFLGGYYGIIMYGKSGFGCRSNIISNNTFNQISSTGILLYADDSTHVLSNTFKDSTKGIGYCIKSSFSSNFIIDRNRLFGKSPLEIVDANKTNKAFNGTIANNQVVQNGSGNWLTLAKSQNIKVAHNSALTSSTLLYEYQSDSIFFANNSIYTTGAGTIVANANDFKFWDNNNYYQPKTTYMGNFNGQNVNSLQDLAKYTFPHNQRCFSQNPKYISPNNLHLTNASAKLTGKYVGVDFDIDGDTRCKATPMIGMDEKGIVSATPSANFSIQDTLAKGYLFTVKNTGTISGAEIISWYLNDTLISNAQDLKFTPLWFGVQKLTLVHTTCSSADTVTDTFLVSQAYKAPMADFTSNRQVFSPGENIRLFDNSKYHPKEFSWSISPIQNTVNSPGYFDRTHYWDPIKDSTTQNPAVVIYYTGKYTVCLKVKNKLGQDSVCKTDYIEIREHNTICRNFFSSDRHGRVFDSGGENIDYQAGRSCGFNINTCEGHIELNFESLDLGQNDYITIYEADNATPLWNKSRFPDGITGNKFHPSFPKKIIAESGMVRIRFTADSDPNTVGKGFVLDWDVINNKLTQPIASFTTPDSICVQARINLTNLSKNNSGNKWDFESDGIINSSNRYPFFKRDTAGTYRILLTAEGACGQTDTFSKSIVVTTSVYDESVSFEIDNCFVETGDTVRAIDRTNTCDYDNTWRVFNNQNLHITFSGLSEQFIAKNDGYYDISLTKNIRLDSLRKANCLFAGAYCSPTFTGFDTTLGIIEVEMAELKKQTSSIAKYTFYNADTARLEKNNTYELSLKLASKKTAYLSAWIDWNGDYDFDDKGELVLYKAKNTKQQIVQSIKVPDNAVVGDVRMRISVLKNPNSAAYCINNGIGESEDYRVHILGQKEGYPEIRLLGEINDTINLNSSYTEKGFIALDKKDGNINSRVGITGTVDTSKAGLYTIVYTVTDNNNNTSTATRKIRIMDFEAPVLSLINGDNIYTELNLPFVDPGYTVSDNLDPNPKIEIIGKIDTSVFGKQILKYCATDASGNKSCLKRTVTVGDSINPIINLLGSDSVYIEVYDSTYIDAGYVYNDNDSANVTIKQKGDWNEQFGALGIYELTYQASDRMNNKAKTTRTIIVGDTTKPTVNLLGAEKITVERWATYIDFGFTYTDNYYDSALLSISQGGTFVNTQSVGVYTIIYRAEDPSGNIGIAVREVEVVQPSSIVQAELLDISIFPNPVKSSLLLNAPSKIGEPYVILNAFGQEVSKGTVLSGREAIDVSAFSSGLYFIDLSGLRLRVIKVE